MVLEKFKRNKIDSDGYIGGRLPKKMELRFKELCSELNISVAEGLRLIIEAEIKAFYGEEEEPQAAPQVATQVAAHDDPVQAAPQVATQAAPQDDKKSASTIVRAAMESDMENDFWDDPAAVPPDLDKLSAHHTSFAIKFAGDDKRNKMRVPCPVCHKWGTYKKFKEDHTKKHGYEKPMDMYRDYEETLNVMLHEAVDILETKKKSREN